MPNSFWVKWNICVCCCREFISEALETKAEEFSSAVVPLLLRQVCTVSMYNLVPNYPSVLVSPWTETNFSMILSLFIVCDNFESWHCLWLWLFRPVLTITPCHSPNLGLPPESLVGFVTETATAAGSVGAPITMPLPRHQAGLRVPPSPSVTPHSAWVRGKQR